MDLLYREVGRLCLIGILVAAAMAVIGWPVHRYHVKQQQPESLTSILRMGSSRPSSGCNMYRDSHPCHPYRRYNSLRSLHPAVAPELPLAKPISPVCTPPSSHDDSHLCAPAHISFHHIPSQIYRRSFSLPSRLVGPQQYDRKGKNANNMILYVKTNLIRYWCPTPRFGIRFTLGILPHKNPVIRTFVR